jgi:hypothetical protein
MALQVPVHHHASARDSPQPIAEDKNLTIFDLPISIRNQIYDLVFYGIDRQKLLNEKEMLWTEKSVGPGVPVDYLGLLRASRRIYSDASAILYKTLDLGSDP